MEGKMARTGPHNPELPCQMKGAPCTKGKERYLGSV